MRGLLVGFFLWSCQAGPCLAWGELGHSVVAEIAARHLSETAERGIEDLLGSGLRRLVEVSFWADKIIDERRYTEPWHTVEIPHDGVAYDRVRDCGSGDCVVEKVKEFARTLRDREVAKTEREEALKFLIHLVADVHVPFHAYAQLNGWEGPWIRIGHRTLRLHVWWDAGFLDAYGSDAAQIAAALASAITQDDRTRWASGTPEAWANESFEIARDFMDRHDLLNADRRRDNSKEAPIELPESVLRNTAPIVGQRLQMAGIRLAWLLNQALR